MNTKYFQYFSNSHCGKLASLLCSDENNDLTKLLERLEKEHLAFLENFKYSEEVKLPIDTNQLSLDKDLNIENGKDNFNGNLSIYNNISSNDIISYPSIPQSKVLCNNTLLTAATSTITETEQDPNNLLCLVEIDLSKIDPIKGLKTISNDTGFMKYDINLNVCKVY